MFTTDRVEDLAQQMLSACAEGAAVFAIDGTDGCGKSTLAVDLSRQLGWKVLHLDDFLEKDKGSYVEHLRHAELREAVRDATRPLIIEGVCMLAVARASTLFPDFVVYVKRRDANGNWRDEQDCASECDDVNTLIDIREQEVRLVHSHLHPGEAFEGLTAFRREILAYHFAYRPHNYAHAIFTRIDA